MKIQDNVNYVKKELSGDEKVLESAFKLETLYKKHKLKLGSIAAVAILFFGGKAVMDAMHQSQLEAANSALLTLQKNADDTKAQALLKEKNPALFELYSYAQAVQKQEASALEALAKSDNSLIADASSYSAGVLENKPVDSKLYKDFSLLEEAYVAIGNKEMKKAKNKLELIGERSPLAVVANFLKHSTLKVN